MEDSNGNTTALIEQEILREIKRLYEDPEGFLIKLRCELVFDEESYNQSAEVVERYIYINEGSKVVSKQAALFVFDMVTQMAAHIPHFESGNKPGTRKLIDAWNEFTILADRLFNFYTYP